MDLTDTYGVFHSAVAQQPLFSAAYETFSVNRSYVLGHKASPNK
jgi:hypothetical protein